MHVLWACAWHGPAVPPRTVALQAEAESALDAELMGAAGSLGVGGEVVLECVRAMRSKDGIAGIDLSLLAKAKGVCGGLWGHACMQSGQDLTCSMHGGWRGAWLLN